MKKDLIKLGALHPSLRSHIRVILASVSLQWTLNYYDKGRGKILVTVNLEKLDRAWSKSSGYVPRKSYPDYQGKLARLRQAFEEGARTFDAPSISYYEDEDLFGVIDGRHRIALARELGSKTIKVAINPQEKEAILKNFT